MANFKKNLINKIKSIISNNMNKKGFGLKGFIISSIITLLCIFLLFTFIVSFLSLTNPQSPIIVNDPFGFNKSTSQLSNSLLGLSSIASNVTNQTISGSPDPVSFIFLIFKGAFDVPITFLNFAYFGTQVIMTNIFQGIGKDTFGSFGVLLINVLFACLAFILVLVVIRYIRSGEER